MLTLPFRDPDTLIWSRGWVLILFCRSKEGCTHPVCELFWDFLGRNPTQQDKGTCLALNSCPEPTPVLRLSPSKESYVASSLKSWARP